jgi:hypothetical protein
MDSRRVFAHNFPLVAKIEPFTPRRGRPPKFSRPSRSVTLTLPEDIVAALGALDPDLSRAIVRIVAPMATGRVVHRPAELTPYGRSAVIVVVPSRALESLPGVDLVPLPDGRALISLEASVSLSQFELKVRDTLDGTSVPPDERSTLVALAEILKSARHSRGVTLLQRNIIVLKGGKGTSRRGVHRRQRTT